MAEKTVIDFDDYEAPQYEEYVGDDPRPGWYTFELIKVGWNDDDTLRWIFQCVDEPYAGWPGFVYANFDPASTKWKNQEVARAIQGGAEKKLEVDFDNDKDVAGLIKRAKRVKGKVERRTNQDTGEERVQLRKVRPLLEEAGAPATTRTRRSAAADVEPEPEPVVEDSVEGDDEPYTEEELNEMSIDDLKEILKDELDQEVPAKGRRESEDKYAEKLTGLIMAAQEADGEGDDFGDGEDAFEEPAAEPEPEATPARRRRGTAAKAAPAKAAAPAATPRRRRGA